MNQGTGAHIEQHRTEHPHQATHREDQGMASDERTEYAARERILDLLSDEEVAKVSTAEGGLRLPDGEEYVDLERIEEGVRQVHGGKVPMGRILPRSAIRDDTWTKVLVEIDRAAQRH